ncbi:dimer_Tnp_hAT domain-containing protein [Trichonephila clavipes]|nr:dimer_Tnp_hAT domain-containing protein [Trichonephila clavipes]
MSPREKFRAGVFLLIIDNLVVQLNKGRDCYEVLNTRFEILRNLHEKEQVEITKQAKYLVQSYPKDIDKEQFVQECQHFKILMKVEKITAPRGIFSCIRKSKLEYTFRKLDVAMRIYLTLPMTNCTAERSFFALRQCF